MPKIYVSICCLGIDQELIKTVKSCFDNAEKPEDVNIGIAFIGNEKFKNFILNRISQYGYTNIKHTYVPFEGNLGVGIGRHLAASMYSNEDYFFQIDAHTFFSAQWDTYLIERFKSAQKHVKNNKVILSGYPGRYGYYDKFNLQKQIFWTEDNLNYPHWVVNQFRIFQKAIPLWSDARPDEINEKLNKIVKDTGFAPLGKISAAFIFSDFNIIKDNLCLDKEISFWEEEIIQTINFFDKGYTVVYPGTRAVIYHFYNNEQEQSRGIGHRETFSSLAKSLNLNEDAYFDSMAERFINYINHPDNYLKIRTFEEYNKIKLNSFVTDPSLFPDYYINSK